MVGLGGILTLTGVVAPVFLLIGLGFGLGRARVFTPDQVRGFGRIVLLVALPALLFGMLAGADIANTFRLDYLLVYGLASLGSFGLGFAWFRFGTGADVPTSAVRAIGMSNSNSAFVGFPVISMVFGPAAAGPLALNMLVENLLMLPLMLALIEVGSGGERHPGRVLLTVGKGLVRSTILWAIVLGAAVSLVGTALPGVMTRTMTIMAGASAPLALVTIGASLAGITLHGRRTAIGAITVGKLLIHPLLVVALLAVFPIADPLFRAAAILFAASPMFSIFPVLAQRSDDVETCSAALLVATFVSFVTLIAAMALLGLHL